jgi:hypothetical protein
MLGGEVIECESVVVLVLSLQPKNLPGVSHVSVVVEVDGNVIVGSLQPPNQPGDSHVVLIEKLCVGLMELVLVMVALADPLGVVVVLSLHPNHPGVLHVEVVDEVVVTSLVVVAPVVVVSSKHPHQPGVSHVAVLVLCLVVVEVRVVVGVELLLS